MTPSKKTNVCSAVLKDITINVSIIIVVLLQHIFDWHCSSTVLGAGIYVICYVYMYICYVLHKWAAET